MSMRRWVSDLSGGLLDLVFVPVCVACRSVISPVERQRSASPLVCEVCWSRTRPIPTPRCARCWNPTPPGRPPDAQCSVCTELPPALRAIRSLYVMEAPVTEIIYALKYKGWEAVAAAIGARIARIPFPPDVEEEVRTVVPVPISPVRRRERGYNQAELIAAAFARQKGLSLDPDLLVRTRATETQTTLHPSERRANVAGAFRVPPERQRELVGEHILLVDDVWTTGATALACTEALLSAGARVVSVLTFARALPELDR